MDVPMAGKVEGKVAFITGAARGQGRSHAITLAREGADIIAIDVCKQLDGVKLPMSTPDDLAETVRQVEALGRRIIASQVDVRDFDAMRAAVDDGVTQLGRLDIVLANAALASEGTRLNRMDPKTWRDMIDVNLNGAWITARVAIPHIMAGKRGGSIVFTSSIGGLRGAENIGNYIASKHGLHGLMRTMALELGPRNIRVNIVCPSSVATPMLLNEPTYRMFRPDLENPTVEDFKVASRQMHVLPIPYVEPADISNAILFLVSDDARYITGVSLPVDGGALLK
ncbi:SDR family mycofactocin-dependent oxidoreductase [Mycobacterium avium subsp. hominissuis]|nr:oxidoreductase [Mycobacterium avium 10-5581]MBZ4572338.1 mycofactocin-coupled SDR family oxidoreductase [Mycobacterium avium subsp. hominissuis]PBA47185.1 SDR family mycofactocin-dependent oxidoreductase [Mycobacterium avium]PBA51756.1 SDR family mycofactocin-dependent oxidoreductase [Mycobacterium avium]PBA66927.1 SDR family mycofactocin-dependent oxidoreductase [Mycobacterium avium]